MRLPFLFPGTWRDEITQLWNDIKLSHRCVRREVRRSKTVKEIRLTAGGAGESASEGRLIGAIPIHAVMQHGDGRMQFGEHPFKVAAVYVID